MAAGGNDTATNRAWADIEATAKCHGCYYSLQGLKENRCPECGLTFDRDDLTSVHLGPAPSEVERVLHFPLGWPALHTAACLAAVASFCATSAPGWYTAPTFIACGIWLGIAFLLAVHIWVSIKLSPNSAVRKRVLQREWRHWLFAAALLMATLLVVLLDVPLRLTFTLSQPALQRTAQQYATVRHTTRPYSGWIGWYHISQIESDANGVRFVIAGSLYWYPCGIEYRTGPQGVRQTAPIIGGPSTYKRLSHAWFLFWEN
jgi:hypothetical protein